jgi:hypothetical protein
LKNSIRIPSRKGTVAALISWMPACAGEEFDGLDVADHLGGDRARLLTGVKSHREPLQLLVDSHPQVVQDFEGGDVTEPTLEVAGHGHQRGGGHHGEAEQDERAGRRRPGQHRQHLPDDQRREHTQGGVNDRPNDGDRKQPAMPARDRQHAGEKDHEQANFIWFHSPACRARRPTRAAL